MLDAITLYHLGYRLSETVDTMMAKHGYRVGRSTVALWLAEHRTYPRLRPQGRRHFPPTQTIRSIKLYNREVSWKVVSEIARAYRQTSRAASPLSPLLWVIHRSEARHQWSAPKGRIAS